MNVKELKEMLEGLPDNMLVAVHGNGSVLHLANAQKRLVVSDNYFHNYFLDYGSELEEDQERITMLTIF